jgi:hypothetical protein
MADEQNMVAPGDDIQADDPDTTIAEDETKSGLTADELDNMPMDELDKLDMSKLDQEETPPTPHDKRGDEGEKDASLPPADESKKPDEAITHDPLKDTKAALTREQQRRAELEKKVAELERLRRDDKIQGFQELTSEQLEELKYDDPDAYIDYRLRKAEVEQVKGASETDAIRQRQEAQLSQIYEFAQSTGVDVNDQTKIGEFFASPEFRQLDQFVTENFKPNDQGLYTPSQMDVAWKALNLDKIVAEKSQAVRSEVINSIQKAGNGGSKLDRLPKTAGASKSVAPGELTIDDIDKMSEAEAEGMLKELAGDFK